MDRVFKRRLGRDPDMKDDDEHGEQCWTWARTCGVDDQHVALNALAAEYDLIQNGERRNLF
jgi:hypothetical protein